MADFPQYTGWETMKLIGKGSFGSVYEVRRSLFNKIEKASVKIISIVKPLVKCAFHICKKV